MFKISLGKKKHTTKHLVKNLGDPYSQTLCGRIFTNNTNVQPLYRWKSGQNICSNCYWSKIAVADRIRFFYPQKLFKSKGNTFEEPETVPPNELHRWQAFSNDLIIADRTQVSLKSIITSARVDSFRIIKNGFLEPATPEVPGALPVLEIQEYSAGISKSDSSTNVIIDTHDGDLVYYPVILSQADNHWPHTTVRNNSLLKIVAGHIENTNLYNDLKMKLFANWEIILTELDKPIITEAIKAALKCKHYYSTDKNSYWQPTS